MLTTVTKGRGRVILTINQFGHTLQSNRPCDMPDTVKFATHWSQIGHCPVKLVTHLVELFTVFSGIVHACP